MQVIIFHISQQMMLFYFLSYIEMCLSICEVYFARNQVMESVSDFDIKFQLFLLLIVLFIHLYVSSLQYFCS